MYDHLHRHSGGMQLCLCVGVLILHWRARAFYGGAVSCPARRAGGGAFCLHQNQLSCGPTGLSQVLVYTIMASDLSNNGD